MGVPGVHQTPPLGLAGIALVLVSLAVFTGREPTGQPKDAPVWKTQVMTIEGRGNHVRVVEDTGRVLLDGNGGFISVVLDGLERAPEGLRRLFEGRNVGKQLLHIADPTVSA